MVTGVDNVVFEYCTTDRFICLKNKNKKSAIITKLRLAYSRLFQKCNDKDIVKTN